MNRNIFYIIATLALHTGITFSAQQPRIGLDGTIKTITRLQPDVFHFEIKNEDQHFSTDWNVNISKKDVSELLEKSKELKTDGYITCKLETHGYELKTNLMISLETIANLRDVAETDKRDSYLGSVNCDNLSKISEIRCKPPIILDEPMSKKTLFLGLSSCALIAFVIWYFKNNITQYIS